VVLGLMAADRLGLGAEAPAVAAAEAKIARVLPPALADRLAALRATLGFTMRGVTPESPDTGVLLTLSAATRSRERMTITYRDTGSRDLDPYGLVVHRGRWYAVGHDHRSDEIRSFRVDRIGTVEPVGTSFEPPPGFDAVEHLNRQFAAMDWQWQVEVLIEADLGALRRRVPPHVADLTEAPGGVLMRCRAERLDGMAQMLAGLGHPFTVLQPAELRTAVADHAARLAGYAAR
jgi:predicted DNA-binding transcriptional regulator YafY